MGYVRFPIPEYDTTGLQDRAWSAPDYLSDGESARLIGSCRAGEAEAYGAYPVMPTEAFFARFDIRGPQSHAILCATPPQGVRLLGRSYSWWLQRVLLVDSLDPDKLEVLADWRTPRPMNTRLGPDDGAALAGGAFYAVLSHAYDDYWLGDRTICENDWKGGDAGQGFRILASAKENSTDFREVCLAFTW